MPMPGPYRPPTPPPPFIQAIFANPTYRLSGGQETAQSPVGGGSSSVQGVSARLPKGILPIEFSYVNMGATLTDSQLYRVLGGAAGAQATQIGYVAPFKGHIVGLSLVSTAAISAGSATFEIFRSGVDTTAELVWTSGISDTATFPLSKYTFEPNQVLDIRATTSGTYAPTTNDIELFLYIAQDAS